MLRPLAFFCLTSFRLSAFKLLDVGAPRTGTQSMTVALRTLGLNPLHSGHHKALRLPVCRYLFGNGSLDDAFSVLDGYDAAMDEPFMLIYEEAMANFPDAKFLLTISDPEHWYKNYVDLVQADGAGWWFNFVETFEQKCYDMASWNCSFTAPSEETKKECLKNYAAHNARVQEVIPAERLLVYNWSDGWAPLAHFLQVPVPDKEFPYVDTNSERIYAVADAYEAIGEAV